MAFLIDAIRDAQLEIDTMARCELYSQRLSDKLHASLEILEREDLE